MRVLITGVQNVIEESVVKLALEGMEGKAKFRILSFSDFMDTEGDVAEEQKVLRNTQKRIKDAVQLKMIKAGPGDHIILNGYFTAKGKHGFFPVIDRMLLDTFKPDFVVNIDVDPLAVQDKIDDVKQFEYHQELERTCAMFVGAYCGCSFKFIYTGIEGAREAANELYELLKGMMVK